MGKLPQLSMQSILTKNQVPAGEPFSEKGSLQISLKQETNKSLPANLVLILDCSHSMRGEPMELFHVAIESVVQNLRPEDVLTVIPFGTYAEVLFKEKSSRDLESGFPYLKEMGATNYGAAFQAAIEMLTHESSTRLLKGDDVHTVSKIALFFTDGHPWKSEPWEELVPVFTQRGFSLNVLGMGTKIDYTKLEYISQISGGHYFHADSIQELNDILMQILDFSQNVVFSLPKLEFTIYPDVAITSIDLVGPPRNLGKDFGPGNHEIVLPDLQSGSVLELLFDITMEIPGTAGQTQDLVEWNMINTPTEITRVHWVNQETALLAPVSTRPAILSKVYEGLDAIQRGDTIAATQIATSLSKVSNNSVAQTGSTIITRAASGGLSEGKLLALLSKTTTKRDGTLS
ncbi:MAG TPA: VWA domain-containing protein [Candidatus Lokiarchaeia archaeon]|nr:VWA domain-containing protein [Candidatus Lokiarchaeia archaeon]